MSSRDEYDNSQHYFFIKRPGKQLNVRWLIGGLCVEESDNDTVADD
jgi:hypothetical protein